MLHLHWVVIRGDIYLADHIKQECLLYLGGIDQVVDEGGYKADLGEKFLDDLGQRLVYGVIIDAREIEAKANLQAGIAQKLAHVLSDFVQAVHLLLI
jgi:hypothetical protein